VFVRFVSGEIDCASQVSAGVFRAAARLRASAELPDYELEALTILKDWFAERLASSFDYLARNRCYDRAICWFKPSAREYLARAWELVSILERNDVLIWMIKSSRTGYVHYEDNAQVFAEPYDDVRLLL